jgi:DNA-binding protein HU-beta
MRVFLVDTLLTLGYTLAGFHDVSTNSTLALKTSQDVFRRGASVGIETYFIPHPQGGSRMAKSMTKSQIADYLAGKAGITKKGAVQILDDLATLAYREAKNVFTVPGIGKLKLANRKARIGRNPQTGEEIKIPAKRVVKFRVAKAAKDAILGKK